jgi:hypothetical protein
MNNLSLQETAEELKKIPGNVRGDIIIGTLRYIHEVKGKQGLEKVKDKVKSLGFSQSLEKITPLEWYPEALSVMIILSAKEIFQWSQEDVFRMGKDSTKTSFVIKTIMKYFVSIDRAFEEASRYWEKYFDFGSLKVSQTDKKNKKMSVIIEGHYFHPDICSYQAGFMLKIAQLTIGQENVSIEETKCFFKGDPYHEYLINWQ